MSAPAVTAGPAGGTDDESRHRQLTVLAGWRRFVDEEPAPPELLPDQAWRRLGDAGRLAYDEARLNHHSRLLVVATPVIRKVITEGRRLSYLNRNADSGRCGLILSGPARTGKTTALTQLAKTLEVIHRQRRPRSGDDIPVIYITVPPAATAKMIAFEFARFLGLPVLRRANLTDIIEAVCGVCIDARTSLVGRRDPQRQLATVRRRGIRHAQVLLRADPGHLRIRRHRRRAHGLLAGTRGEQIAGRFAMVGTRAFPRGEYWTGLVAHWRTAWGCTGTSPAPSPGSRSTCTAAPGHDRQPAPPHPRRRRPRRPRRHREDHPHQPRRRRTRHRLRHRRHWPAPARGTPWWHLTTGRSRRRCPSGSGPPSGKPSSPISGAWPGPTTCARACCGSTSATPCSHRGDPPAAARRGQRQHPNRARLHPHRAHSRHRAAPAPPPSPAESQRAREARPFGVIRDNAARGISIRQIAGRRHVHRRMVRQALAEPAGPPPRKRGTRPAPAIGPVQDVLDKLAGEPLTVWEIWTTVTDQYDSDASYAAIRDYIRTRRLAGQPEPPPGQ